jgi:SPX domain protein involved in polyphosphate accumulation
MIESIFAFDLDGDDRLRMTMSSDVAMVSSCRTQFNAIEIDMVSMGQYGCLIN